MSYYLVQCLQFDDSWHTISRHDSRTAAKHALRDRGGYRFRFCTYRIVCVES